MNSKPVIAVILVLLVLSAALTVARAAPLPASVQIVGDQLTITLFNPSSADVTVVVTVFQYGQSLGTVVVTVPAGSTAGPVWSINDDLNPFGLSFSLAAAQN